MRSNLDPPGPRERSARYRLPTHSGRSLERHPAVESVASRSDTGWRAVLVATPLQSPIESVINDQFSGAATMLIACPVGAARPSPRKIGGSPENVSRRLSPVSSTC